MTEQITFFHNPRCSKSRATLELLREHGLEPRIVEYLKTPPSEKELAAILKLLGMEPRVLRVEARAVLETAGAEARLQELELRVVRSDPMAALQKRAMSGEFGSGEIEINLDDMEGLDQEEGATTVYRVRPSDQGPSAQLKAFRKRCSDALADQEF